MAIVSPKIDKRTLNDIILQAESLAAKYLQISPSEFEKFKSDGTTTAIFQIFARLVQIILQRLNKVPDKNFLAFLDMVGVSLSPPKAARAPLKFTLAEGSATCGSVPAGTQVATAQTEEQPAVVFETVKNINVITSNLVRAFSVDPNNDSYSDHSEYFIEDKEGTFDIFKGKNPITHLLILGHDQIFGFTEPSTVILDFEISESTILSAVPWEIEWYHYIDDEQTDKISIKEGTIDETNGLTNPGKITFDIISEIFKKTVTGIEKNSGLLKSWTNNWIIAKLTTSIPRDNLPQIDTITANIVIKPVEPVSLDLAFTNNMPNDLSKDYFPFGEKPKFNDTFRISSQEVFSKEGVRITISVVLSEGLPTPDTENIKVRWEFWDGKKWDIIGDTKQDGIVTGSLISDTTKAFTNNDGEVIFDCPKIELTKVYDEENYWIRVRIIDGDYGKEATYQEITVVEHYIVVTEDGVKYKIVEGEKIALEDDEETEWIFIPATYKPPSISSLKLDYTYSPAIPSYLQHCLSYNNFEYIEHGLDDANEYESFKPFALLEEMKSLLYLGFDQDISTLPVTLYFSIMEKIVSATESSETPEELPTLIWEYWDGSSWTKFDVEDATRYLSERELIQFLAPNNISSRYMFNLIENKYYWIRIRVESGEYIEPPEIQGIYLNTVWAYNRVTVPNEILGSSNEKENQTFELSQSPVFPRQKLMVRELEAPPDDEREVIIQKQDDDAIQEIYDENGNLIEVWIRWREVDNFYASGPDSRDYVLDHVSGTISFGDGVNGLIPPRGRDNIKCTEYQFGGGFIENLCIDTINELRTSIPYIDSVTNIEAAAGGADAETIEEVKERGPQTLKHRDRAVTWEDYEWLVKQSSTAISRVKCISAKDSSTAGKVKVIIVPYKPGEIKPFPSRALIRQVENYLYQRGLATLTSIAIPQVKILGPGYVEVSIEATVVPEDINQAPIVESQVGKNLTRFLHPLNGGPEGKGWPFGRDIFISEIFTVIEETIGVDHIKTAQLNPEIHYLILEKPFTGTSHFLAGSSVKRDNENKVVMILAQDILVNTEITTIAVKGFKDKDEVIIRYEEKTLTLTIKSVQQDILFFEPFQTTDSFPGGSEISTSDGRVSAILNEPIAPNQYIESIKIRGFANGDYVFVDSEGSLYQIGIISNVDKSKKRIYIDENYLVYSGTHIINMESS